MSVAITILAVIGAVLLHVSTPMVAVANVPLVLMTVVVLFSQTDRPITIAILAGTLLDLVSPLPFGIYVAGFLGIVLAIRFLFHSLFTNRSLYAVMTLTASGTILFWGYVVIIPRALESLHLVSYAPAEPVSLVFVLIGNLVLAILLFYTVVALERGLSKLFFVRST